MDTRQEVSSVHPSILFHFTNFQALRDILADNFKYSYALETLHVADTSIRFAVPMVSFCDLRISDLKAHINSYGEFGIGLTKKWAASKGLTPVMYMSQSNDALLRYVRALGWLSEKIERESSTEVPDDLIGVYNDLLNLYRYFKPYEGELCRRKGEIIRNYRFANEREWRSVPQMTDEHSYRWFVRGDEFLRAPDKSQFNAGLSHLSLSFEPDDIRYLIVSNEEDVIPLVQHLRASKSKFTEESVVRLTTRILTCEQIVNDV